MKTRSIALIVVLGVLYALLTVALAPLSYGPLQVRIAEVLKPALYVLPLEGTVGIIIGVIVANFYSPMGISDVLQAIPGVAIQGFIIWLLRKGFGKAFKLWQASILIAVMVALWVGSYLWYMFKIPWMFIVLSVLAGELVAVVILGIPVWTAIRNRLPGLEE